MLVLSRRKGERVMIGRDVVVTVLESHGGRVRIGISAPRELPIKRQELLDLPAPGPEGQAPDCCRGTLAECVEAA